jgi:glycine cleavage system pyridoxal-binding protein P
VAAVLGSTSGISGLQDVADNFASQFSMMESALSKIGKDMIAQVKDAVSNADQFSTVFNQLSNMAKQLKAMMGDSGINLEKLYSVTTEKQNDITYLKNTTQRLKATAELTKQLAENAANKPVTQTWFEYGG